MPRTIPATRTYVEQRAPDCLLPAPLADPRVTVRRLAPCPTDAYRALYRLVGERWHWRDRNFWSDERLAAHLAAPGVEVWVLERDGAPGGYFELQRHDDGSVEIVYFGLAPAMIGQGLGKALLTRAVERAWALGATRVWLHTCTLDGPAALPNYLARGFTPYHTEAYEATLPDDAP